jgi:ATP-dependent protease Clp ATPase subunit
LKTCDFCSRPQDDVMMLFSNKSDKAHICDFCIKDMDAEIMKFFRTQMMNEKNEADQLPRPD